MAGVQAGGTVTPDSLITTTVVFRSIIFYDLS